jgi:hypothetical protein
VQRDCDRLLAVLYLAAAASAVFEFAVLVFVHYAVDSFLLS